MIGQAKRLVELNKLRGVIPTTKFDCPVITVTSGKGGTGKSFFSLNSALALAALGKKILLVDLDKNLSNIHIMLNEIPSETIYGFLSNRSLIDDLIVQYQTNLHCIFGDSGKSDHPEFSDKNLEKLFFHLSRISKNYDYIVIDTASGIGEEIKFIIAKSSAVIIVTNPEPTSIMDSYVVLKTMRSIHYDKQKFVVINKSPDYGTGSEAYENLEKAVKHFLDYNISPLGVILNDSKVSNSIIKQIPIMMMDEDIESKNEINKIVRKLGVIKQVVNNHH